MQLGEWHNTWLRQMREKRQMLYVAKAAVNAVQLIPLPNASSFLKHYISVSSSWKREYLNEVLLDMRWDAIVSLPHPPTKAGMRSTFIISHPIPDECAHAEWCRVRNRVCEVVEDVRTTVDTCARIDAELGL